MNAWLVSESGTNIWAFISVANAFIISCICVGIVMTSSLLVLELKCSRRMRFDPVAAKTCSRADLYISADTDGITMRLSCTYAVGCILGFLNQYINPRMEHLLG
jgi:hypothetical protein